MECNIVLGDEVIICSKCKSPNIRHGKYYCCKYKINIRPQIEQEYCDEDNYLKVNYGGNKYTNEPNKCKLVIY